MTCDGYPTEEELNKIKTWTINNENRDENYHNLMAFVKSCWHWHNNIIRKGNKYTLITGGWSGNEEIIAALKSNHMFWMLYWHSSTRGGRHIFMPVFRARKKDEY